MAKRWVKAPGYEGPTPDDPGWPWLMLRNALDLLPPACHNAAESLSDGPDTTATKPDKAKERLAEVIRLCDAGLNALPRLAGELDARISSTGGRWTISVHTRLTSVRHAAELASISPECPGVHMGSVQELRGAVSALQQMAFEYHAALRLPPTAEATDRRLVAPGSLSADKHAEIRERMEARRTEEESYRHIPYEHANWVSEQIHNDGIRSEFRRQALRYLGRYAQWSTERARWTHACDKLATRASSDPALTDREQPPGDEFRWHELSAHQEPSKPSGAWIIAPAEPRPPHTSATGIDPLDYSYTILAANHDSHVLAGHGEIGETPLIEEVDLRKGSGQAEGLRPHWNRLVDRARTLSRMAVGRSTERAKHMVEMDFRRKGLGLSAGGRAPGVGVVDLLRLLASSPEGRLGISELPNPRDWEGTLRIALADGLAILERRRHCFAGRERELRIEQGWEAQWGKGDAPVDRIIEGALDPDADSRIACHVRITEEGKTHLARFGSDERSDNPIQAEPTAPNSGPRMTHTDPAEAKTCIQSSIEIPKDYIPTSKILRSDGSRVPATTVASWRSNYPCDHWIHPSTREVYHPRAWVEERLRSHRPGRHPPKGQS